MRNAQFGALAVLTFLLAIVVILYVQDYDRNHAPQIGYEESITVDYDLNIDTIRTEECKTR